MGTETLSDNVESDSTSRDVKLGPGTEEPRGGRSFLTHAMIYGLAAVALQAASVLLVPLYTRYLTPAEFGVLELLSRIGEVLSICLLANGVRLAAFTFYCQSKDEEQRRLTAATLLLVPVILAVGSGLLGTAIAPLLEWLTGVGDPVLGVFAVVLVTLEGATTVPLALVQARLESSFYVLVTAGMFALRVSTTILTVVGLGWGVWGVLGASAITSAVFAVLLIGREFRRGWIRPDLKRLWEILRFSLPFVPVGFFGMALHNGDRFFLMRFCGADEVGQYALGYKLAMAVGMFAVGPLNSVWNARMYDVYELPDAACFVGQVCTRMLAAYVFVGLGVCIFQGELVALFAAANYHGATVVIGPVVLAYFFWTLANLFDATLWVRRRTDLKPWILLVSASVTVALYGWLIPRQGAIGAAYATLAGMIVHCAITLLAARRVFRVHYEFGRLAAMLILAVALNGAAGCLGTGLAGCLEKLALWAAWPAALWFGRIITPEERSLLLGICLKARQVLWYAPART